MEPRCHHYGFGCKGQTFACVALAVQIAALPAPYRFGMKWRLQSAMALRSDEILGTSVVPGIVQQTVRNSMARALRLCPTS